MANPLFYIGCSLTMDITPGSSTHDAYFALQQQYQFGVPLITNRAPAELATAVGVTLYSSVNPLAGITPPLVPGMIVTWFPYAQPTVVGHDNVGNIVFTRGVSTADNGGTLVGVNYVDANGVLHPDVDWKWSISVEPYFNTATGAPPIGKWEQQLITYVGNGIANRLIPTSFALDSGVVAVWINPQITRTPSFRHSGMTGTGMAVNPASATQGIMAFQSGGFTVKDGASCFVNVLGESYTAVVFRDSTSDNRYMRVGDYQGLSAIVTSGAFTLGSAVCVCGSFGVGDIGRTFTSGPNGPAGGIITGIQDSTHFIFAGASRGTGTDTINAPAAGRSFATGRIDKNPTHVWVAGRVSVLVQESDDMPAANSMSYELEAKSLTNQLTALGGSLGTGSFNVGTDNNVNNNALHYYWVAFTIPVGDAVRLLFATFKATGTGGTVVVPLSFAPGLATARQFTTGVPTSVWRGPLHTGTTSRNWDDVTNPALGITALGAASLSLGTGVAPNGQDVYGFAVVGGVGTVTVPATPVYVAAVVPVADGTTTPTNGCTATIAPGAGNSGGSGCSAGIT